MAAGSGQSSVTIQLWLEPDMIKDGPTSKLLRHLQAATRRICLKHDSASARGVELQLLKF